MGARADEHVDPAVLAACDRYAEEWRQARHRDVGVHLNTTCPHCGGCLELFDSWQPSEYRSVATLDCGRCGIRWALQAQLAQACRLPRRRGNPG